MRKEVMSVWRSFSIFKSAETFSLRPRNPSGLPDLRESKQPLSAAPAKAASDYNAPSDYAIAMVAFAFLAHTFMKESGFNGWVYARRHEHDGWIARKERRKRCEAATADLESLERDIDDMKAKLCARVPIYEAA